VRAAAPTAGRAPRRAQNAPVDCGRPFAVTCRRRSLAGPLASRTLDPDSKTRPTSSPPSRGRLAKWPISFRHAGLQIGRGWPASLESADEPVRQNSIEAPIVPTNAILVVFVERIHDPPLTGHPGLPLMVCALTKRDIEGRSFRLRSL
jgi:hypothetical protein